MEIDYRSLATQLITNVRARTPKVTGNLSTHTQFITTNNNTGEWGRIVINTPYAQFVNYGYENHPNSVKLNRDYLYVEKSIRSTLQIVVERYGGKVK